MVNVLGDFIAAAATLDSVTSDDASSMVHIDDLDKHFRACGCDSKEEKLARAWISDKKKRFPATITIGWAALLNEEYERAEEELSQTLEYLEKRRA